MGKKIRYKYLTGSMKEPIFQFINKIEFFINPRVDPRGSAIANHWHTLTKNTKTKFKGQNFDSQINYDLQTSSSYVTMNFVNGWKKGFYFRQASNDSFEQTIQNINKFVAYQRMAQGYQDEYQDED